MLYGLVNVEKIERQIWEMFVEIGIGFKVCCMSVSLFDDFVVDVVELQLEFEYENKLFGCYVKLVGKGGYGKVKMMVRKGCFVEFVVVKEFCCKLCLEMVEEYEKKIKFEYILFKSLNYFNVVMIF